MMFSMVDVIVPDWPAPSGVKSMITTRRGGVSVGDYASLNLGLHVGDHADAVHENRRRIATLLPAAPLWLNQVHGTAVIKIVRDSPSESTAEADAAITRLNGRPCAVMVADCLPLLFCDEGGTCVGATHAGWRGLAAGVIERTVDSMSTSALVAPAKLMAYLGPAIGATAFEVGQEVVDTFAALTTDSKRAFVPVLDKPGKYLADIFLLARQRLAKAGVHRVYGGNRCTVSEPEHFFSYRRDSRTGRMAALIWRE